MTTSIINIRGRNTNERELDIAFEYKRNLGVKNMTIWDVQSYLKDGNFDKMYEQYPELLHHALSKRGYGDIHLISNLETWNHAIILANHMNYNQKEHNPTHRLKKMIFISPVFTTTTIPDDNKKEISLLKLIDRHKMKKIHQHEQKLTELSKQSLNQMTEDGYYVPMSILLDKEKETESDSFIQMLMSHGFTPEIEYVKKKNKVNTF